MSELAYCAIQNLTKRFRGVPAVGDLWLEIRRGERLALLGPSGCGKSTTLQLIAGLLAPDSGQIVLNGRSLVGVPPERREMALVLQRGLLFPHLSVGENVAFGLKLRGVNRAEREAQALAMLAQVQLSGFENRRPAELSGGQAQRVALARSLVIRPKLLLLDEPLSALDANLRSDMQNLILQLQAETGVTMLVVTHDQSEAVVMAHRIALMFDGCLRQVDTPEALYQQPSDATVARFFGGVNFFEAIAEQHCLRLSGGNRLTTDHPQHGPVQVTIRPERIHLLAEPICGINLLPVTITQSRFTGTQRHLALKTPTGLELQAWVPPGQSFTVGESAFAHLPADALWSFPSANEPSLPDAVAIRGG
ncbi:MAG: ABC transporter ATP-binding protein [Leptolyngbyaceae cyanobacterium T60_A2020_046]|nr:ABC transporter ATP-binding protein [Leptolyngbyaceae cyanobacterium T60_A2020_046]